MLANILRFAKAHVALVGAAATWAVATFPDGQVAHIAAAVLAVLTALGVAATPNKPVGHGSRPARQVLSDPDISRMSKAVAVEIGKVLNATQRTGK